MMKLVKMMKSGVPKEKEARQPHTCMSSAPRAYTFGKEAAQTQVEDRERVGCHFSQS